MRKHSPRRLSRGQRQRLSIARAIIHDPHILLMDEPFTGLDASGRIWLLQLIAKLQVRGRAICMTTHDADIVQQLAPRIVILRGGELHDRAGGNESIRTLGRMTDTSRTLMKLWWIVQKDLVSEYRTRQAWPRMLLLGLVVAFLLTYQMKLPSSQLAQVSAGLCWLTICFAAVLTLGQSIAAERDEGCWQALLLYPVAPETVYFAKVIVNCLILGALQLVVVPFFAVISDSSWLSHPWQLLLVSVAWESWHLVDWHPAERHVRRDLPASGSLNAALVAVADSCHPRRRGSDSPDDHGFKLGGVLAMDSVAGRIYDGLCHDGLDAVRLCN